MNESISTVFAPSSAIGGAIAVIRVSGPDTRALADAVLDRPVTTQPGQMKHVRIQNGDAVADDAMAVFFRAPHSYTGEDMLELHCHGGLLTVKTVLSALSSAGGVPAEPGEFTKRAFLNGKLDLSQAEAVMDVINAQAQSSLRAALDQLGGGVSRRIRAIEPDLIDARSALEAAIDYPDEAEDAAYETLPKLFEQALNALDRLIADGQKSRVLREGMKLVIVGRPNVGKSSLLNALLGEDRAIVTAVAGTTRDVLDESFSVEGVPVRLIDTAGLRDTQDEAERIGVDRARQSLQSADAVLLVLDGSVPETEADRMLRRETEGQKRIVVANKSDLGTMAEADLAVSCKTGAGIDALKARIAALLDLPAQSCQCITNERHIRALQLARDAVAHAAQAAEPDCIATDLVDALHALGTITGTDVDAEVIDRIFANFCVGK